MESATQSDKVARKGHPERDICREREADRREQTQTGTESDAVLFLTIRTVFSLIVMVVILVNCVFMAINREIYGVE